MHLCIACYLIICIFSFSSLSPYSFQSSPSAVEVIYHSYDSIPLGALPLFAVSGPDYQENVTAVITAANEVYKEFLHSEEGSGFNGQVSCFI